VTHCVALKPVYRHIYSARTITIATQITVISLELCRFINYITYLHGLPAPTHRTVSDERWTRSCFNEWAFCCSWQHLWGTVLEWVYSKAYNTNININIRFMRIFTEWPTDRIILTQPCMSPCRWSICHALTVEERRAKVDNQILYQSSRQLRDRTTAAVWLPLSPGHRRLLYHA